MSQWRRISSRVAAVNAARAPTFGFASDASRSPMLRLETPLVPLPSSIVGARRLVDQHDVAAHGEAKASAMRAKTEIEIVEVETIEGLGVEWNRRRYVAPHRHENAVERLDAGHDERPAAEHHRRVAARFRIGRGDQREYVRVARRGPLALDQARRARDADQIEVGEMPVEARGEIGREDLDVVVGQDQLRATRLRDSAVVAFSQRARVVNADDLDGLARVERPIVRRHPRKLARVDAADDDGHRGALALQAIRRQARGASPREIAARTAGRARDTRLPPTRSRR